MFVSPNRFIKMMDKQKITPTEIRANNDGRTYTVVVQKTNSKLRKTTDYLILISKNIFMKGKGDLEKNKTQETRQKSYTFKLDKDDERLEAISMKVANHTKKELAFNEKENEDLTKLLSNSVVQVMTGKVSKLEEIAAYNQIFHLAVKARDVSDQDLLIKTQKALNLLEKRIFETPDEATKHRINLLAKAENFEAFLAADKKGSLKYLERKAFLEKALENKTLQNQMKELLETLSHEEMSPEEKFDKLVSLHEEIAKQMDTLTGEISDRDKTVDVLMCFIAKDYEKWKGAIEKTDQLLQDKIQEIKKKINEINENIKKIEAKNVKVEESDAKKIKELEANRREYNKELGPLEIEISNAIVGLLDALGSISTLVDFDYKGRWGLG